MPTVLDRESQHEQVVFCQDATTGLKAIIAIYSTALGPALGGTRCYPYSDEDAALADVLGLASMMAYKSALAGLDLGGGKAVIIGDPATAKSRELLQAYGRFVSSLGGRYITACDVGTDTADMDVIASQCPYVTGRSIAHGGGGDPSALTAFGVTRAMAAAVAELWGAADLASIRVGVQGAGKVGSHLVDHLVGQGAKVLVYDVSAAAISRLRARHPEITVVGSAEALISERLDVYAPCAMSGALTPAVASALQSRLVCGAANSQLSEPGVEQLLADRGISYAPDFVVNAGGLIQVADELTGYSSARARARAERLYETTRMIFRRAASRGTLPGTAARELAELRIAGQELADSA